VRATERVGTYTLLRLDRGSLEAGLPGQFFMLRAEPLLLPRPMSICTVGEDELGFLIEPIGTGTEALSALEPGQEVAVLGPLGHGFPLDATDPILVGGGVGIAPLPYLSATLGHPPALLGFRTETHAVAAELLPHAEVVIDPVRVTEPLADALSSFPSSTPLACGPEPMLEAVAALAPHAWLAHEAPMACGYGACFGCVVPIDGVLKRLCLEGPTMLASRIYPPVEGHAVRSREAGVAA
jgi:NAD(P)H-flavin reductase